MNLEMKHVNGSSKWTDLLRHKPKNANPNPARSRFKVVNAAKKPESYDDTKPYVQLVFEYIFRSRILQLCTI